MIFVLSFMVFGASGVSRPFPSVRDLFCNLSWGLNSFFSGLEIRELGTLTIVMATALWIDSDYLDPCAKIPEMLDFIRVAVLRMI